MFGVVFVNTAEKYHPQEKFWGKRCQEVRGVSLHFFGSFTTDLAKITCGISNFKWRSECTKAPFGDVSAVCTIPATKIQRSEPIPVGTILRKTWEKIGSTPPNPIPHSHPDRFVTSLAKMKFQLHQGSRLQPSTWLGGGAPLEFGVWGVKLELVGAVGWVG